MQLECIQEIKQYVLEQICKSAYHKFNSLE